MINAGLERRAVVARCLGVGGFDHPTLKADLDRGEARHVPQQAATEPGAAGVIEAAGNEVLTHVAAVDLSGDDHAGVEAGTEAAAIDLLLALVDRTSCLESCVDA